MKNKLPKYFLAIFSLVFFLLAFSADFYFRSNDRLLKVANHTQQVFEKKEKLLHKDLGELKSAIADKNGVLRKYQNFTEFEKDLKKDGFVLIAYQQDSLIFWSDNSFLLPEKRDLDEDQSLVVKLQDGYY